MTGLLEMDSNFHTTQVCTGKSWVANSTKLCQLMENVLVRCPSFLNLESVVESYYHISILCNIRDIMFEMVIYIFQEWVKDGVLLMLILNKNGISSIILRNLQGTTELIGLPEEPISH